MKRPRHVSRGTSGFEKRVGMAGTPARGLTSERAATLTHLRPRAAWPAQTHLPQAAEAARPGLGRPVSAADAAADRRQTALHRQPARPPARPATAPPPRHWLPAASILLPPRPFAAIPPFCPPRPGEASYQEGGAGKSTRDASFSFRDLYIKKGRDHSSRRALRRLPSSAATVE